MDSGNVGRNSGFLSDVVRRNACERARFVSYGSGLACQHAGGVSPVRMMSAIEMHRFSGAQTRGVLGA
jgi:hypothetical protein